MSMRGCCRGAAAGRRISHLQDRPVPIAVALPPLLSQLQSPTKNWTILCTAPCRRSHDACGPTHAP